MEDGLSSDLGYEDKEMLRRKLAQLRMEYSKTAQKLQRAEHSQVIRQHVRSRITDLKRLNEMDPAGLASSYLNCASPSLNPGSPAATFTDSLRLPGSSTVLSENTHKSPLVRFLLPSETTSCQTPDPGLNPAGCRASPAGRLRSRRSRLRLEREKDEKMTKAMEVEVVEESEELSAYVDSESPPSLLPYQPTVARGAAMEELDVRIEEEPKEGETEESESPSLLLTHWNPATDTIGGQIKVADKEKETPSEKPVCDTGEGKWSENSGGKTAVDGDEGLGEAKREKGFEAGLMDSYTVVEGLPFPAEYYVRTTRRMSSSHSQPNLQAVILNQFTGGRQRRGRNRGAKRQGTQRGSITQVDGRPRSPLQRSVDPASLTAAPTSSGSAPPCQTPPDSLTPAQPTGETQSSAHLSWLKSQTDHMSANDPPAVEMLTELAAGGKTLISSQTHSTGPIRGRRRKRGRGRGRGSGVRRSLSLDADPPDSGQGLDHHQASTTRVPASQPLPEAEDTDHSPVPGSLEQKVYPMFTRSSAVSNRPQKQSKASWRSFLLPYSPSPSIILSRLPPLCPPPPLLRRSPANRDLLLDFHLPDDEFALLKLTKLRQVATAAAEPFSCSPYNTRRTSARRAHRLYQSDREGVLPLPLPLSLTPTVEGSPPPTGRLSTVEQSTVHFVDPRSQCTTSLTQPPVDDELKRVGYSNEDEQTVNAHSDQQSVDHPLEKQITFLSTGLSLESPWNISPAGNSSPHHSVVEQPCSRHFVEEPPLSLQSSEHLTDCHVTDFRVFGQPIDSQLESELTTMPKEEQSDFPSCCLVQCPIVHQTEDKMSNNSQSEPPQSEGSQSDHNEKYAIPQSDRSSLEFYFPLSHESSRFTLKCPSIQTNEVSEHSPVCPTKNPTTTCSASPSPKPPAEVLADLPAEEEVLMDAPVDCSTNSEGLSKSGGPAPCLPPARASSQLLRSPCLASPTSNRLSPRLVSSTLPFSPPLPSIGLTPHLFTPDRPRCCSSGGLSLGLPLSPGPSPPQGLSPPPLRPTPLSPPPLRPTPLSPPHLRPTPLSPPPLRPTPLSPPPLRPTPLSPPHLRPTPLSPPPLRPTPLSPPPLRPTPLSPPPLSPCPALGPLYDSPPRLSPISPRPAPSRCRAHGLPPPSNQEETPDRPPAVSRPSQGDAAEPPPVSRSLPPGSLLPSLSPHGRAEGAGGELGKLEKEGAMTGCVIRCTHTIQTPAGGCLVDACCVPVSSGGVCVVAAGEWAVCVWGETSSHWSLIHTWTFKEPVISVFPVLDAAGLLCVTLGQLEIREVRVMSCFRFQQELLCEGQIQTAMGVANARVVSSSHSAAGMALQVSSLSLDGSVQGSLPLVPPGVFVWALAAVEGLPDALVGSASDGLLFVWNTSTGQLLRRISLAEDLAHTACLRGFSSCGVLFVLLQHQSLNSPRENGRHDEGGLFSGEAEEGKGSGRVLFSLVATNPLSGTSALATRLGLPAAWSRRLCEADVLGTSVVGLSQCGRLCVWELGGLAASRMVWDPEDTAWQLARWGGQDRLLVGHNNGDLSLYHYTPL